MGLQLSSGHRCICVKSEAAVTRSEKAETHPMMCNGWFCSPPLAEEHFAPKLGTDAFACTAERSWLRVSLKVVVTLCAGLWCHLEQSDSKHYGCGRPVCWPCGPSHGAHCCPPDGWLGGNE